MEQQTDGVEWVMATLFIGAMILVAIAAVLEVRKARRGDPGGDDEAETRKEKRE
jgi:hypothetical protein